MSEEVAQYQNHNVVGSLDTLYREVFLGAYSSDAKSVPGSSGATTGDFGACILLPRG